MRTVDMHAVETNLSRLIDDAAAGEEIIIEKDGRPVGRLMPLQGVKNGKRRLGGLEGKFLIPENFDDPLPDEFMRFFDGRE